SFFPFMDEIDEIWYLLNKSFYEQIKGHSLNLQSLVGVLKKIRNTKFTREEIVDRLDLIGFYNEEAVNTMLDLALRSISQSQLDEIVKKFITNFKKYRNYSVAS